MKPFLSLSFLLIVTGARLAIGAEYFTETLAMKLVQNLDFARQTLGFEFKTGQYYANDTDMKVLSIMKSYGAVEYTVMSEKQIDNYPWHGVCVSRTDAFKKMDAQGLKIVRSIRSRALWPEVCDSSNLVEVVFVPMAKIQIMGIEWVDASGATGRTEFTFRWKKTSFFTGLYSLPDGMNTVGEFHPMSTVNLALNQGVMKKIAHFFHTEEGWQFSDFLAVN